VHVPEDLQHRPGDAKPQAHDYLKPGVSEVFLKWLRCLGRHAVATASKRIIPTVSTTETTYSLPLIISHPWFHPKM
jgi:hypothetical protein